MKHKILAYTVQHTGTWFLIRLLHTAEVSSYWDISDGEVRKRGRPDPENLYEYNHFVALDDKVLSIAETFPVEEVDDDWLSNVFSQYMTEQERLNDLVVFNCHLKQPESNLVGALREKEPSFPIVSSMRDPLLAIQTLIWRQYKSYSTFTRADEEAYHKFGRAHIHLWRIENILDLPREKVFVFPVDTEIDKNKLVTDLFSFCGLETTERTAKYIEEWKPQNNTSSWEELHPDDDIRPFEDFKQAVAAKDKTTVRKMLPIAFDYLHSRDDIKRKLEDLGYNNLVWF